MEEYPLLKKALEIVTMVKEFNGECTCGDCPVCEILKAKKIVLEAEAEQCNIKRR